MFYSRTHRLPPTEGRGRMFSDTQEIVDMIIGNSATKLWEIRDRVLLDNITFARVLEKHEIRMKQLYTVPFERDSERVKELRYQYVQVTCLFNNEAGYIRSYS